MDDITTTCQWTDITMTWTGAARRKPERHMSSVEPLLGTGHCGRLKLELHMDRAEPVRAWTWVTTTAGLRSSLISHAEPSRHEP